MNIWVDTQLPPTLAAWLTNTFRIQSVALRDIQLRDAYGTPQCQDRKRVNLRSNLA